MGSPQSTGSDVRLNKFIADCGVTSRRKADDLIRSGQVKINGRTHKDLGTKINPTQDRITVQGKNLTAQSPRDHVYVMFNKPKQVLTAMHDPEGRPTVADFFRRFKKRLFPVGRLDWDSEGLLLMTNDGELAHRVTHPKEEISKTYLAKVDGQPTDKQLEKLKRGVTIIGGKVKAVHIERIKSRGSTKYEWIKIVVTEGKNRQVRRMFEKIGYDVLKLQRIAIGRLHLGRLKKGEYRVLTSTQVAKIF